MAAAVAMHARWKTRCSLAADALLNAMADDDNIKIADDTDLNFDDSALDAPEASRLGDHDQVDDARSVQIEVDVKPDENAVMPVESDRIYVWQLSSVKKADRTDAFEQLMTAINVNRTQRENTQGVFLRVRRTG